MLCLIKIRRLQSFDLYTALPSDPVPGILWAHVEHRVPGLCRALAWKQVGKSHLHERGMSPEKGPAAANRLVNMAVTHLVGSSTAMQLMVLVFKWPLVALDSVHPIKKYPGSSRCCSALIWLQTQPAAEPGFARLSPPQGARRLILSTGEGRS